MTERRNTIRSFALVTVAVTSAFIMAIIGWLIYLLQSDWCSKALGAGQLTNRPDAAIGACFTMMRQQIFALSLNSYIFGGVIAMCLLVLMVIVVAGGRLSFKASKDGVEGDIAPEEAARQVADAADEQATAIEGSV